MNPRIGLLDCNNFFVSCERIFRPDLQNKPVLVLSSNDGCVVARSQEVKDMGIPMGVPFFQIKDTIKDNSITVFSGNLTLYRDISCRVFSVVASEFSTMEQYSVDEAFVVFSSDEDLLLKINIVRDRIMKETGIPVSIGVGQSKTLAKYAAVKAKQSLGGFVLTDRERQKESKILQLSQVWGVGRSSAEKYRKAGLNTVAEFVSVDTDRIARLFGVNGVRMQAELRGECVSVVGNKRQPQQSIMSSRSFNKKTNNKAVIADATAYHVRHIAADLRAMDSVAASIRVSLGTSRHGDFILRGGSKLATLTSPTADTFTLLKHAQKLMDSLYEVDVPYQKVGVIVSDIRPGQALSQSLFDEPESNNETLLQVIDSVNNASHKELITFGTRLKTPEWQSKAAVRSNSYTTRWVDIVSVSAK